MVIPEILLFYAQNESSGYPLFLTIYFCLFICSPSSNQSFFSVPSVLLLVTSFFLSSDSSVFQVKIKKKTPQDTVTFYKHRNKVGNKINYINYKVYPGNSFYTLIKSINYNINKIQTIKLHKLIELYLNDTLILKP